MQRNNVNNRRLPFSQEFKNIHAVIMAAGQGSSHSRPRRFLFLLFACFLFLLQVFQQRDGYHDQPGALTVFSDASNCSYMILGVTSIFIKGRHLGLPKYHKSRVPLYGVPSACITMQLVKLGSFKLLLCSGDIQQYPGPVTGADRTLFGDLRSVKSYGSQFVSIGHSNVRRLYRHLSEVKILIEHTNLDILTLSETHLTGNVLDKEVHINGYQFVRRDPSGRAGGGVAIYFKDHLTCAQITKYDVPDLEANWIVVISISQ